MGGSRESQSSGKASSEAVNVHLLGVEKIAEKNLGTLHCLRADIITGKPEEAILFNVGGVAAGWSQEHRAVIQ